MKPAWSWQFDVTSPPEVALPVTREWAWGDATGAGVSVAVIDSGIDVEAVGPIAGAVAVDGTSLVEGPHDDAFGHGTACAGLIRRVAPDAEIYSVKVLGASLSGTGSALLAGVRWALERGIGVINLSLSTKRREHYAALHELADRAYFRNAVIVAAVNNVPAISYPAEFSSVVSVAATEGTDPFTVRYNPSPPVEFGAPGIGIRVPWPGGGTVKATGNSFAAAHVSGLVARILSKHPGLTPFQVKAILHGVAS
ncbi:hypothetical protein Lesp02_83250 [Lentzea sp. NBRC 105346]|uniref:S8 family serine peptidase n=1 Tax=Lentzea sp. NBRC 105346 TaxID=3032205 RepID=UPI0024A341A5|nr:S8 family serine peptidase [Lentzea sp. NBRC 105346]GLZ36138.1 hypothetical protein Lesp02_83250 [Lentzea sp. NBRC 105346]